MANSNGSNGSDRLDRIERIIEVVANTQAEMASMQGAMQQDIKNLYLSQVVMGETLTKVAEAQRQMDERLSEKLKELAEAQKHTDENMNALILTVDEIIRGRKRE